MPGTATPRLGFVPKLTDMPTPTPAVPLRHHWLNTLTGILDGAFYLTDEEQLPVTQILGRLIDDLRIPDRGVPATLPAPVALELSCNFYTVRLSGPQDADGYRPIRAVSDRDLVVDVETWTAALVGLFLTAYPDMAGLETVHATNVLEDLLIRLGVPQRAAAYFPEEVLRAYWAAQGR